MSWLADPALLQTADRMSDGYQVLQDGALVVGDRELQARQWLTRLAEATRSSGMRALPYADIDASAVTRAGMSNDVVRAVTQGPGIAAAALGAPVPGDLYWAPFGRLDRPSLNVLASAGVTTLVLVRRRHAGHRRGDRRPTGWPPPPCPRPSARSARSSPTRA